MQKKASFLVALIMIMIITIAAPVNAQDTEAQWMDFFNKGDYKAVISEVEKILPSLEWAKQGIPMYFMGESYYNLGLAETGSAGSFSNFKNALSNFDKCFSHADLFVSEYKVRAQFKKGFAQFRIGELGEGDAAESFKNAYKSFTEVDKPAPNDLLIFSLFMAGEAKYCQAILEQYEAFSRQFSVIEINSVIGSLNEAKAKFDAAASNNNISNELKIAAQIRRIDVFYQLGKLYQCLTPELFNGINDANKRANLEETIRHYFTLADYQALQNQLPADKSQQLGPILLYSEAIKFLNLNMKQRDEQLSLRFSEKISELPGNFYENEKLFRKGNQDQAIENLKDQRWSNLASNNSYYARASSGIPESYFWLGFIQSVLNRPDDALASFNNYLDKSRVASLTLRRKLLREDAVYQKHSLAFERIMRINNAQQRLSQFQSLRTEIDAFKPQTARLQIDKDKLLKKVRTSIEIARGGNDLDKAGRIFPILNNDTNVALEFVEELLPQAASVVSQDRAGYLGIVDVLLIITKNAFPNETRFYRGIAISLRAEIDPSPAGKRALYLQSADTLAKVQGNYRNEADYICARALFFGAEYDRATQIFADLINNHSSLRALFYLGETYRATLRGAAARRCYEIIKEKTRNAHGGSFWYNNADAGLNKANSEGTNNILDGISIANVRFPDVLSRNKNNDPVQYEYLADVDFLQLDKAKKGLELLLKFGLPKRNLYPSTNVLNNSQFVSEGIFPEFKAPINEVRGAVTSGLKLFVVAEAGQTASSFRVTLGEEALEAQNDGVYTKEQIDLNTNLKIKVENQGYYPFLQEHVFKNPQADTLYVVPSRKLEFSLNTGKQEAPAADTFPNRLDQNIILHAGEQRLPQGSKLYEDVASNPYIRDYIYHPTLEVYLLVDAINNKILRISNTDQPLNKSDEFSLAFEDASDKLSSPEGIAVDSDGNIYIVDWGNHRVLIFKMNGSLVCSIGVSGENSEMGAPAKLIFPTRIAIAEDSEGVSYNNKTVKHEKQLFISDRNGVHLLDERGHFLDTVVKPSLRFSKSSFYGISVAGYGETSTLYLADRQNGEIAAFSAKAAK